MRRQRRPCTASAASAAFAVHATYRYAHTAHAHVACAEWHVAKRGALVRLVTERDFNASKEKAQTLSRGTATVLYI